MEFCPCGEVMESMLLDIFPHKLLTFHSKIITVGFYVIGLRSIINHKFYGSISCVVEWQEVAPHCLYILWILLEQESELIQEENSKTGSLRDLKTVLLKLTPNKASKDSIEVWSLP